MTKRQRLLAFYSNYQIVRNLMLFNSLVKVNCVISYGPLTLLELANMIQ